MARHGRDPQREAYWRGVLKRFSASGLSVRTFCRRERLTESAFFAWRRTIAERDGQTRPSVVLRKAPAFVPAVVTSGPPRGDSISIELAGGRVLRLPQAIPVERLAALVRALEARAIETPSLAAGGGR
jgi:hypothetical protein